MMPAFSYEALDKSGQKNKGVLSADNIRIAKRQLIDTGLTPLSITVFSAKDEKKSSYRAKISSKDLVLVTRQLAILISAATPVEEALQAVAGQMPKPAVRNTMLSVRTRVMEGWRLSLALAEHQQNFSDLYRGIVASGESSGDLGAVLNRLADMLEKNRAMMMKALTAMIYPLTLFIVCIMVVSGLMVFVIPRIVEQFDLIGSELPFITRLVMGLANFLTDWGIYMLVSMAAGIILFWQLMKISRYRLLADGALLRIPAIGRLISGLDAARFARTMATLFGAGVPLLDCLKASRQTVVNEVIKKQIDEMRILVQEGTSFSMGLRRVAAFPAMLGYLTAAGERSGELTGMLEKAALQMEMEFETATTVALRLIEPVIIVVMGGIVMLIMLAVFIPVLQFNTFAINV